MGGLEENTAKIYSCLASYLYLYLYMYVYNYGYGILEVRRNSKILGKLLLYCSAWDYVKKHFNCDSAISCQLKASQSFANIIIHLISFLALRLGELTYIKWF